MIKKFVILYVCFLLTETIVNIILMLSFGWTFEDYDSIRSYYLSCVQYPVGLNLIRLMFYSIPLAILFFVLFKYFNRLGISYKPVAFSIFNVLVFVGLNLLYKLHRGLPTLEFTESLFWITILSIFLSPIILGQIPYFRRLMESI